MKCRCSFYKVLRLFHFLVILIDSVELRNVVSKQFRSESTRLL